MVSTVAEALGLMKPYPDGGFRLVPGTYKVDKMTIGSDGHPTVYEGLDQLTYVVDSVEDLGPHMVPLSIMEVADDVFVTCANGVVIQLGVPLCAGCDEAVGPGLDPCSCEREG